MKCMLIKVSPATEDVVALEGLFYSYTMPQEECAKVVVLGAMEPGKGLPVLAVCSKVTIDRRIGQVFPAFPAAAVGRSWDYVWYLTVEQRPKGLYLPQDGELCAGLELELSSPAVQFTYRETDVLDGLGLSEAEGSVLNITPEAADHCFKKSSRSSKAKAKKEEAARKTREKRQQVREEAAKKSGPEPMVDAELFSTGDAVTVEVGFGVMRKSCPGTVLAVEDRFSPNPYEPSEQMRVDQIVSVEVAPGQVRKFSARALRQIAGNQVGM